MRGGSEPPDLSGHAKTVVSTWRRSPTVTSMVVQDGGLAGAIFNLVPLAMIGFAAEQAWGPMRWTVIALTGTVGVLLWGKIVQPVGAGNSVAVFSLAASIAVLAVLRGAGLQRVLGMVLGGRNSALARDWDGVAGRAKVGNERFAYFRGHPGSRLEARFLADAAGRAGLRLIGLDRPGQGLSDYQPIRRLGEWSDDVAQVIDRMGLQRVAIIGNSAGPPYALDCAHRLPGRVTARAVVSGAGEVNPLIRMLASWMPWPLLLLMRPRFADPRRAQRSLEPAARRWPQPDQRAFKQPGVAELLADSLAEAFRQGVKGAAQDGSLLGRRWTVP